MTRTTRWNAPSTIRSTHTVSQPLTERGTMSVPTALYHAVSTSNAPTTAAAERPMSGTTTSSPGGQWFLRTYRPRHHGRRWDGSGKLRRDHWRLARPGGAAAACRPRAASDSAISRRIFGANSRASGAIPPSASTLLTTRTPPVATGSSTWSKTTLPSSIGHSLTQRRPGSTAVMTYVPPMLPRCLAHPDTPGSNGPSSRAISLLTSHSGQRATSVHTAHTAAGPACSAASHSNRYMVPPRNSPRDQEPSRLRHSQAAVRTVRQRAGNYSEKRWPACPGYAATMVMRDGNERAGAGRRKGAAPGVSEPRMELAAAPVADGIVAGRPCTVRKPMTAIV